VNIKKWPQKQRRQIIMIAVFVLGLLSVAFSIRQYTVQHHRVLAEQASWHYEQFLESQVKDERAAKAKGEHLLNAYPKTPYATLAGLTLAAEAEKSGDWGAAKTCLKRLLKDGQGSLLHLVRLRLARVLTQEQDYEEALVLLNQKDRGGFGMLYQDLLGDIYVQQARLDRAREAYQKAIDTVPLGISSAWIRLKQAALVPIAAE